MIGDRLDTDVISGLEAGLRTILVLTGSTSPDQVDRFSYQPTRVVDSIADVVPLVEEFSPERLARAAMARDDARASRSDTGSLP